VTLVLVPSYKPTPRHLPFTRRLRELVAPESQQDVANKLDYTQGRVSQVLRGEKPSREFVERLIAAYDLPRDEWLASAGFVALPAEDAESATPDDMARVAAEAAQKAVEGAEERFRLLLRESTYETEWPLGIGPEAVDDLPPESMPRLKQQVEKLIAEERRRQGRG
jgi:transcriptional regulator with XRE-family HTH domain